MKTTFQELWARWPWQPIRNCPGRYILPWEKSHEHLALETLLGMHCTPQTFTSPGAKDRVLVWPLADGGLISYQREDGRLLHTLNTSEGFTRKLQQLEISLDKGHLL